MIEMEDPIHLYETEDFGDDEVDNKNDNNIIIDGLLSEFSENRQALMKMISDLEELKTGIEKLFPTSLDKRYMRLFEERIKTTTELFKALLSMRQEVTRSLKDEIELRRKVVKDDFGEDDDLENLLDLRSISRSLSKLEDKKDKLIEKHKNGE